MFAICSCSLGWLPCVPSNIGLTQVTFVLTSNLAKELIIKHPVADAQLQSTQITNNTVSPSSYAFCCVEVEYTSVRETT